MLDTSNNPSSISEAETKPDGADAQGVFLEPATPGGCTIMAGRAGEWIDACQLRDWALAQSGQPAAGAPRDLVVDLKGMDYLEAAALQVLLAVAAEQRARGAALQCVHASQELQRWFEFGGAADLLQRTQPVR